MFWGFWTLNRPQVAEPLTGSKVNGPARSSFFSALSPSGEKQMTTVLVAGAGGYIGIVLCGQLLERGHSIIALDRYYFGVERLHNTVKGKKAEIIVGDIRDFDHRILRGVDVVVDLAGLSNDTAVALNRELTWSVNVDGAMNLALAAKNAGVFRYVYASSASVYGHGNRKSLTEEDECRPLSLYAESKRRMEEFLLSLNRAHFETVVLRFATVFGLAPRMRLDLAINIMTMHAWKDGIINIVGNGEQWRPFIHVRDAALASVLAIEETDVIGGEVFNIGHDDMNYQIRSLPEFVRKCIPGVNIRYNAGESDPRTYNVSFAKVRDHLGFVPIRGVQDGISEVKSALANGLVRPNDLQCYTAEWYRFLFCGEHSAGSSGVSMSSPGIVGVGRMSGQIGCTPVRQSLCVE
jgi:nucleoside-diphosphate-sugar epimerase